MLESVVKWETEPTGLLVSAKEAFCAAWSAIRQLQDEVDKSRPSVAPECGRETAELEKKLADAEGQSKRWRGYYFTMLPERDGLENEILALRALVGELRQTLAERTQQRDERGGEILALKVQITGLEHALAKHRAVYDTLVTSYSDLMWWMSGAKHGCVTITGAALVALANALMAVSKEGAIE